MLLKLESIVLEFSLTARLLFELLEKSFGFAVVVWFLIGIISVVVLMPLLVLKVETFPKIISPEVVF